MEAWSAPERNTQIAACFAALGFPCRIEKQTDAATGHTTASFFFRTHTAPGFPPATLSAIRKAYDEGEMERDTPHHPLLMGMRAMHNLNALVDWIKQGKQQRLVTTSQRQFTIYKPGTAHAQEAVMVDTGDIDACAALASIGVPVCSIDGYGNAHRFHIPAMGMDLVGTHGTYNVDAAQLLKELRAGTLDEFDDDFMAGYNALRARRDLLGAVKNQRASVLIQKPGSMRRAYVMENATGQIMDKVKRHFKIA